MSQNVTNHKSINMKLGIILTVIFLSFNLTAQIDTIGANHLNKYYQINMGLSYGNLAGNVSEFIKHGGALNMGFADGRKNTIYGFNMDILLTGKRKEFTIPAGYEHYTTPATVLFGLFYGQILGDQHQSHFQATIGINYGWLLHRKLNQKIGGYHGFVPQIELTRSIRLGKTNYSDYQFTSQYTPRRYDPSLSNKFIDLFLRYQPLLFNNEEGKGSLISFGIRYKINKYSISKNTI